MKARAEDKVHLAHVVGGTRHGIAHRLQVVKGHALAQQACIELLAHVALDALGGQLEPGVASELQHAAHHLGDGDHCGDLPQFDQVNDRRGDQVVGLPDQYRG